MPSESSVNFEFSLSTFTFNSPPLDSNFISKHGAKTLEKILQESERHLVKKHNKTEFWLKGIFSGASLFFFLLSALLGWTFSKIFFLFTPIFFLIFVVFGYKAMSEHFEDSIFALDRIIKKNSQYLIKENLFIKAFKKFQSPMDPETKERKKRQGKEVYKGKKRREVFCLQVTRLSGQEEWKEIEESQNEETEEGFLQKIEFVK